MSKSTFYNMQSVSSSAVYNALNNEDYWSILNGGIYIKKIGRWCYVNVDTNITGASPIVLDGDLKVPERFRCIDSNAGFRTTYINNNSDVPEGQFIIYPNGVIRFYKGGGGTISCIAVVQGVYLTSS